ncbi:hypothetical protein FA15DRAFT_666259 [Coprinopsis marcescibilis]|uniref:Uncharacterized protein n=1 Tax=Coprinopsis marcescibilis TaxID=230819 RepID=A0A5C3L4G6_COPMA|nr:hypothetical protein FA15DRAFT_666259 [Coprinopsis marcescibilis]
MFKRRSSDRPSTPKLASVALPQTFSPEPRLHTGYSPVHEFKPAKMPFSLFKSFNNKPSPPAAEPQQYHHHQYTAPAMHSRQQDQWDETRGRRASLRRTPSEHGEWRCIQSRLECATDSATRCHDLAAISAARVGSTIDVNRIVVCASPFAPSNCFGTP